jgi:hypothetical protein
MQRQDSNSTRKPDQPRIQPVSKPGRKKMLNTPPGTLLKMSRKPPTADQEKPRQGAFFVVAKISIKVILIFTSIKVMCFINYSLKVF